MRANDLDRLDRATFRAWRWSNLVGWGLAGVGVTILVGLGIGAVTTRIALRSSGSWADFLVLGVLVLAGVAGGIVVGSRVYRSPGLVAFLGQQAIVVAWITWDFFSIEAGESTSMDDRVLVLIMSWVISLLVALPATTAARMVWRRRPRALRAPL
jgi:hypothetical protein